MHMSALVPTQCLTEFLFTLKFYNERNTGEEVLCTRVVVVTIF